MAVGMQRLWKAGHIKDQTGTANFLDRIFMSRIGIRFLLSQHMQAFDGEIQASKEVRYDIQLMIPIFYHPTSCRLGAVCTIRYSIYSSNVFLSYFVQHDEHWRTQQPESRSSGRSVDEASSRNWVCSIHVHCSSLMYHINGNTCMCNSMQVCSIHMSAICLCVLYHINRFISICNSIKVGSIDRKADVAKIAWSAANNARMLCHEVYCDAPEVILTCVVWWPHLHTHREREWETGRESIREIISAHSYTYTPDYHIYIYIYMYVCMYVYIFIYMRDNLCILIHLHNR